MSLRTRVNVLWRALARAASRQWLVVGACVIVTLVACIAIDSFRGHDPLPEVHDEYAYLLAGDTFDQGRLTNPPHALWRSFETYHVLQKPSYQAKYPPGQGLFLALGTVVAGRPIVGVYISAALLAGALCWMLQAWVPPRWALLGSVLGIATMVLGGAPLIGGAMAYWSQTYWGGAVAALGGALLLGGVKRAIEKPHWSSSVAMGVGASILAMTRPYEGLLVTVPVAAVLVGWLCVSRKHTLASKLVHVVLPGAVVVACGLAWLAYYNHQVTGDWRVFPYAEYQRQYQMVPLFALEDARSEPAGLNAEMLRAAQWEVKASQTQSAPARRLSDMYRLLNFEVGALLAPLLLLLLPLAVRQRWMAFAAVAWGLVLAGMFAASYFEVHYHAPAAGLTLILVMAGLRRMTLVDKGPRVLWRTLPPVLLLATLGWVGWQWAEYVRMPKRVMEHWAASRQEVIDTLTRQGGKHVVFVRYGPEHLHHIELVYNAADVDASAVVWARDLGAEQNIEVLNYYPDRSAWLMLIPSDQAPAKVVPVPREAAKDPRQ